MFLIAFGYAAYDGLSRPFRNWDMVAYVGSAISWTESDPAVIYKSTLADVETVVWPHLFEDITKNNTLSKEQNAFMQQLPFYTVKPLYVGLMVALHEITGLGYAKTTFVIAVVSFLLLGALLALWRPERLDWGVWLLVITAFTWVGYRAMENLAHFSTPDALATLLKVAAIYFLVKRERFVPFVICAVLAVLARPDALILMVFACGLHWLVQERTRRALVEAGGAILALLLLSVLVQWAAGGYPWPKLFYYSFIYKSPYPATEEYQLTPAKYLEVLERGVSHIFSDVRFAPVLVISLIASFCYFMYPVVPLRWPLLLGISWAAFAARYALYPAWWEYRYYYPYHLLSLAACAEMIPPYAMLLWRRLIAHRENINLKK